MDRSISIYHFLRFSEKQWQLIDNSIQPQNRMRLRDYCEIYEENGIEIEKVETRKGDLETVASMPVHHDFQGYTKEELAISHALVIS